MARTTKAPDALVERLRTDRVVFLILALVAVGGIALLMIGERTSDANHPIWRAITLNLGGLFVATATLTLLWELAGKRRFAQEVLAAAGVAADVRRAGLRAMSDEYLTVADWPELFRNAPTIDLLASWGATWRKTHERNWIEWIKQPNVHLRVLLPDPTNADLMRHLAERFNKEPDYVQGKITETTKFYEDLQSTAGPNATVTVRHIVRAPVWAYYGMGATVVATLYPASIASAPGVPAMVFDSRGETGQFFRGQFAQCWDEAQQGSEQ